jgi:tetratricopeptide (TPR) repeat protein
MLSRRKQILFSLFPTALLIILMGTAEVALRMTSPSDDDRLVREARYDGVDWFQINRGYLRKYFPPAFPYAPEFKSTLFRKKKGAQTFRVMCLGESSMFGTPYDMNANIPGIVRKQLRALFPEREIEVVNWGASAINSNVIVNFLDPVLEYEPDLVLVYMGHNEFYGPDGIGASFLERHFPGLTQVKYALNDFRLVKAFRGLLQPSQKDAKVELNLMRQVSGESLVPLGSPDAARVLDRFEKNLREMLRSLRERGVPAIVSDVGSNLLFPPFVSDSLLGVGNSEATIAQLRSDCLAGVHEKVIASARGMLPANENNPSLNFWLGKALYQSGKPEEARPYLMRARDNDLLKFRAPGAVNAIIRRVCGENNTPIVFADSMLSARSPGGIPGEEMYWEHLHPTAKGYYLIASLFIQKILELQLIPGSDRSGALLPFDNDSLSICWLELAYADLSIQHLTGKWPFHDYSRASVVLDSAEPPLREIVQKTYDRSLGWDEACYRSAALFRQTGRRQEAITTYEALLEDYPFGFYPHYLLGGILRDMGEPLRAAEHFRISIRSNPAYAFSHLELGLLAVNLGEFDEAISELNAVLGLAPGKEESKVRANALYGLAAAHANKGDVERALSCVDEALRIDPGYRDVLNLKEKIRQSERR